MLFIYSSVASLGPESMDEDELEVITWKVLPGASQRQKDLLVENQGFSYTIKRKRGSTVDWRCSKRSKLLTCPATVIQRG